MFGDHFVELWVELAVKVTGFNSPQSLTCRPFAHSFSGQIHRVENFWALHATGNLWCLMKKTHLLLSLMKVCCSTLISTVLGEVRYEYFKRVTRNSN